MSELNTQHFVVMQRRLPIAGNVAKVPVPAHTSVLDIHYVNNEPHVRTVEPEGAPATEELVIVLASIRTRVEGKLTHIPTRHGGGTFFLLDRPLQA